VLRIPGMKFIRRWSVLLAFALGGTIVVVGQVAYRILRPGPVDALAVIDGRPISVGTFQSEMLRRGGDAAFATAEQRRALLDELIRVEVLASNAVKANYGTDPDVRRAMDQLLADRYQRKNIDEPLAQMQVTESDVADYYHDNLASYTVPAAAHAAVIMFAIPAGAPDDAVHGIEERAARIRQLATAKSPAADFAALAAQYSDDSDTRTQGGDIGWIVEGQDNPRWEAPVVKAILELANPGDISPLVRTPTGVYFAKLLENRSASVRPLNEVRTAIEQQLVREERERRAAQIYAAALKNVTVTINEAAVAAMEAAEKAVVDLPHGTGAAPQG
jgi:parvulin-like peptidyl-prolyl isomerase